MIYRSPWVPTLLMAGLLVAGCGGEKPESLLASAKTYLANNDSKAAIIQVKNALKENPDLPEGRFLLGRALLDSGSANLAELELRKALALGFDKGQVLPKLASAMLAQGLSQKLIDEFGSTELAAPAARAEFKTALSAAYASLGKSELSEAALAAALTADPKFVPAMLSQARRTAGKGDIDGALTATENIIATAPTSHEAWGLKGDLLQLGKRDTDGALAAFRKAVELKPAYLTGQLRIAAIELQRGRVAESEAQLEVIKKLAPNHPETRYQQAQLAILKKDLPQAREAVQQLLKIVPESPRALQLAGMVELQLNSLLQAETMLKKALQKAPELTAARRALVQTYMRSGQASQALATLNAAPGKDGLPPELYATAGEVYLQTGDAKKAEEYFQKALKLNPDDARRKTAVAVTHLVRGDVSGGFDQLQDIAASDAGVTADLALISAHLRRREFDQALAAIERLEKKQPDKPLAAQLRGRVLMAQNKPDAARASFEAALKIDPGHFPAIAALASMDIADKKPDAARKRFEAMVEKDPKDSRALMALSQLTSTDGKQSDESIKLAERAIAAKPAEAGPRLLLIEQHLRSRNAKQAVAIASAAVAALPENPQLLEALGRAQLAAGDQNQAIGAFTKLVAMQPRSPLPLLRMAEAHAAANNKDGARESLRRALEINPDLMDAQRALIALDLSDQRYAQALATARSIQKKRPKDPAGYAIEGDIQAVQKNWDLALVAFKTALKQAPSSSEVSLKIYMLLATARPASEAAAFSAAWRKDHPKDTLFLARLGDFALNQKDYATSEKLYEDVLQIDPNNSAVLNNLAWIAANFNKSTASGFAERANALVPNQPAYLDTWAFVLSQRNEHSKAIEIQKRALGLQPENPSLRLNLAKVYIKAGDKTQAKTELQKLKGLGEKFSQQAEVADLLNKI